MYGPSLVMDYVLGQKLNDLFWKAPRKGQPSSSDLVLQILKPITSALDYIHQAGVLHGDVRPQNIIVVSSTDPIWDVRLIDFGIACRFGENADGSDEMVNDNPLYKAPEQLRNDRNYSQLDGRTDLFSLATVAYELLAAYLPFSGDDDQGLLQQIIEAPPEVTPENVPLAVEEVL